MEFPASGSSYFPKIIPINGFLPRKERKTALQDPLTNLTLCGKVPKTYMFQSENLFWSP